MGNALVTAGRTTTFTAYVDSVRLVPTIQVYSLLYYTFAAHKLVRRCDIIRYSAIGGQVIGIMFNIRFGSRSD